MVRRSPAEYYLRYCAAYKKWSAIKAQQSCQELGLFWLDEGYYAAVRSHMAYPRPFFPDHQQHVPSTLFLRDQGIEELVRGTGPALEALALLKRPAAKEAAETLLVGRVDDHTVSTILKERFHHTIKPSGIQRYRHYFFNLELVDRMELRCLIEAGTDRPTRKGLPKTAGGQDPRAIAANLPTSPLSSAIAQIKLGYAPSGFDTAKILARLRDMAIVRSFEQVMLDAEDSSKKASGYMTAAERAQLLLNGLARPDDELRKELSGLRLRHEARNIPTIRSLAGANFSSDYASLDTVGITVEQRHAGPDPHDPERAPGGRPPSK